ncbi:MULTISPECIES: DUF2267 domain-containing protein [Cyanophyceae]|uniref:DUF2267 domain-containing protein n=1 Tax=Cyanophyceae TaxID=3028117 RepID=UPI001689F188|nr:MULTISPECIES: DUF2267 domain-containing protein [Cyanophyceae]MBD1917413.1 DUF2267 domain-containing protein [Phormidium sp. FACHB-77]MBD2032342.1 DUF2267 domain-containing protein [Phormidium sp. FACHB-322]MBD2052280.1 DUF2267 domain-containing protein [Leptolyngbya sp. FACHB-60]
MASQTQQQSFLDKVLERSSLQTPNDAERATNIVFRILRDMMLNKTSDRIEEDLKANASEAEQEVLDLWKDPNVMVAFFSRISPAQDLHIKPGTFMLRLQQEGALPSGVAPEEVTKAVFSATKEILPAERNQEIASLLPGEIRQIWEQA